MDKYSVKGQLSKSFCLSCLTEYELLSHHTTAVDKDAQNSNGMSAGIVPSGGYLVILNVWSSLCYWDLTLQQSATRMCCSNNAANQQNGSCWFVMACWTCQAADAMVSRKCCFWTGCTSTRSQGSLMRALFCLNSVPVITSSSQSLSRKPQLLQWGKIWRGNLRHWWKRWKPRQTRSAKSRGIACRWGTFMFMLL